MTESTKTRSRSELPTRRTTQERQVHRTVGRAENFVRLVGPFLFQSFWCFEYRFTAISKPVDRKGTSLFSDCRMINEAWRVTDR